MEERITQELTILRHRWPDLEYKENSHWVRVPSYHLPEGWNRSPTEVAFQIPVGYPGVPPYGIYVPAGLMFRGSRPDNYTEPAPTQPPFPGSWGIFSWTPADGQWRPTADITAGSNLLNWVIGFADRFREGK
jgi:hypothetical protein